MNPKLIKTKNYDQFNGLFHNRPLHDDTKLKESMKRYGFIPGCAIYCTPAKNGKLNIIKGHHRLNVAKELQIPVWAIVDQTAVNVWELEGSSKEKWTLSDFASSRAIAGNDELQKVVDYASRNQIGVGLAAVLLAGQNNWGGCINKSVKDGTYQTKENAFAELISDLIRDSEIGGVRTPRNVRYVQALASVACAKSFNRHHLSSRLKKYGGRIPACATKNDFIREIEALYNLHSQTKVPLAFEAAEAMKNRGSREKEVVS